MLQFDPKVGLYADNTDTIREAVRNDWKDALGKDLNVDSSSPAGQLIDSETAFIAQKDSDVLYMSNQFNPKTAEGVWQEALGQIYFLTRKVAEPTVVLCMCTGLPGTVIPAGSIVKNTDGITLISINTATILGNGTVNISFQTQDTGPILIGANTVTTIITTIAGWDTVNNTQAGVTGRDVESRLEFEQRRFQSVAKNGHGTLDAITGEIANIQGVLDVIVLENTTNDHIESNGVSIPGHSIYISVYGGSNDDIASAIYHKKDAGCGTAGNTEVTYIATKTYNKVYTFNIERPDPLSFAIQVNIRTTPTTPTNIADLVKTAILNNFNGSDGINGRVKIASTVYASRFYTPAVNAGVQDLVSVKIAAPVTDSPTWVDEIVIDADQVPTLSEENILVNVISS